MMKKTAMNTVGVLSLALMLAVVSCQGAPAEQEPPVASTTAAAPAPVPETPPADPATPTTSAAEAAPTTSTTSTTTTTTTLAPAKIPHTLTGRENCLMCHQTGVGKATKVPANHSGRTNEMCLTCHQPG